MTTDIIEELLKEKEFKGRVARNKDKKIKIVLKRYYRNPIGTVYYIKIFVNDLVTHSEDLSYENAIGMFEKFKEKYNLVEVD